jgi:hypothetical protein
MSDIANEFQGNYRKFEETARQWTEQYASQVDFSVFRFCWMVKETGMIVFQNILSVEMKTPKLAIAVSSNRNATLHI